MPQPPTPNMGIVVPTENGDNGTWDEINNAAFERVDEHDHTTGKGLPITPAAIDVDEDLAMQGHSLTGLQSLDCNAISAALMAARVRALYWNVADGDLYARNASGQTIRITNGGALDVSLVGGIGGDYTTTDAEVEYDFTNDRYKFLSDASPETYSKVAAAAMQLISGVYSMNVVAPTLSANKTITLPQHGGAGQRLLQIDNAGVITPDNTVDEALVLNGAVTATAAMTASDLTLVAGDAKHGDRTKWISACNAFKLVDATLDHVNMRVDATAGLTSEAYFGVPMEAGQRIKGFIIRGYQTNAASTFTGDLYIRSDSASVSTDSQSFTPSGATSWKTNTKTLVTPRVLAANQVVLFKATLANIGQMRLESIGIVYDRV